MKAVLVLEDGSWFSGDSFGTGGTAFGEIVFNTSMTGYQEILTDPSYKGQMIVMTYPLIGNYGMNDEDMESCKTIPNGFIVKELCESPSSWRLKMNPAEFFAKNHIQGIKGIDTRALTTHIRKFGSMFGIISTESGNIDCLLGEIFKEKQRKKRHPVYEVTAPEPYHVAGNGKRTVVMDLGAKMGIIRSLAKRGCDIYVVPAGTAPEDILRMEPDGIVFSNGPGDPAELPEIIHTVRVLAGKKPSLGICLGHQLLGLAFGGTAYKLKFGHHGGNHPVKDLAAGKCTITSQNHNYAIRRDVPGELTITHLNVNDGTVEGIRHKHLPAIGVQFHPEAAPGPEDSAYIFDQFMNMMDHELAPCLKTTGHNSKPISYRRKQCQKGMI